MRTVTVLAAFGLLAAAFWSGYAYSEYRIMAFIVESQRSCNLSTAEAALRTLDFVKDKGLDQAREDVVMVAKSLATDRTQELIAGGLSAPTFGTDEAVATLREINDARYASLQERIARQR